MNTLIVYDSQYGNTARIAQTLADALRVFGQAQAVCGGLFNPSPGSGPADCGKPHTGL